MEEAREAPRNETANAASRDVSNQIPGQPATSPSLKKVVTTAIIVSLLASGACLAAYDRFFAQKIVTVNIGQFMLDQQDLYVQGKITKEEFVENLSRYAANVKNQPKNRVVILEDVVAGSVPKLQVP